MGRANDSGSCRHHRGRVHNVVVSQTAELIDEGLNMTRREKAIERFANVIARLEDAQNSETLKSIIDDAGVQGEINSAKSKLISVLHKMENA